MPLTSDADRSDEINAGGGERTIPLPVAIGIVLLIKLCICVAGYLIINWI